MDDHTKAEYEAQSLQVRAELKKWESDWAAAHNGSKPGRNDIKHNPDIAHKYKQYNRLRDIISGKIPPPTAAPKLPPTTPSKRSKTFQTPRKAHSHQAAEAKTPGTARTAATPSTSRKLFSPALPTSIGPTPQKDGHVLGLFDLLGKTPSKPTETAGLTPSKRRASEVDSLTTPSAKRTHLLPERATPLKESVFGSVNTPLHERPDHNLPNKTPSTSRSAKFSTPAFLRRSNLPPVDEQDENGNWKVGPLRLPRKFLSSKGPKGLSQIVTSLRTIVDEAYEDEEDVLRELESGAPAPTAHSAIKNPNSSGNDDGTATQAAESRAQPNNNKSKEKPALLSAFDDPSLYDSDSDVKTEGIGRDGFPLRVYKKKGQKRTTRKVNIKPTRTKRPAGTANPDNDAAYSDSEDEIVKETQYQHNNNQESPEAADLLRSSSEFDNDDDDDGDEDEAGASEFEELSKVSSKKKEKKSKKNIAAEKKTAGTKENRGDEKEGVLKKTVRKIKATAHANFKSLKLRNTGAKGGPGYNSRFRRRR
ncbi:putative DNA replication regulator sld-2 [Cladorrhinum samala]|uniref:DNA replication regulator SLD2 n=1 Tax=Cladorrhinum samala TaxID=585594 RepID=A0AAV9HR84_9PEZI|nr:putative DNA replication regulator sld-2 [Cladorrhinum samala]